MTKTRTRRHDKAGRSVGILPLRGLFCEGLGRRCRTAQGAGSSGKSLSREVDIRRESASPSSPKAGGISRCWSNVTIALGWNIGC